MSRPAHYLRRGMNRPAGSLRRAYHSLRSLVGQLVTEALSRVRQRELWTNEVDPQPCLQSLLSLSALPLLSLACRFLSEAAVSIVVGVRDQDADPRIEKRSSRVDATQVSGTHPLVSTNVFARRRSPLE